MADHLTIDGSLGEGGGQVVRSSLALAAITGRPMTLDNIRANRKPTGLKRQHLTAVKAAAEICQAELRGASLGSSRLDFTPGLVRPGEHTFDVGTAGSCTLVFQTVLPALITAEASSKLTLRGGTHNAWAPTIDFVEQAYLPLVNRMGSKVVVELVRPGFYPQGGGEFIAHITPSDTLSTFDLPARGKLTGRSLTALVANLPTPIGQRECDTFRRRGGWPKKLCQTVEITDPPGPGNAVVARLEFERLTEVFSGFGQRGIAAEKVAADVWRDVNRFLDSDAAVGEHLADQLLLPLGLAVSRGAPPARFTTLAPTKHTTTQIEILRRFLDVKITIETIGRDECEICVGG
jgi:RNA 3'-terminal phosphate cyclase (ATP)